jgi:hypothetical protein
MPFVPAAKDHGFSPELPASIGEGRTEAGKSMTPSV